MRKPFRSCSRRVAVFDFRFFDFELVGIANPVAHPEPEGKREQQPTNQFFFGLGAVFLHTGVGKLPLGGFTPVPLTTHSKITHLKTPVTEIFARN